MVEFLEGQRRKIGVVTLVLACVLMAGWFRSHVRYEYIEIPVGNSAIGVASMHGGIDFSRTVELDHGAVLDSIECKSIALYVDPEEPPNTTPWGPTFTFDWRWDWAGFHIGQGEYSTRREQNCRIPYWSIVLPLTLLSAWLLLSGPRPAKKAEPAPAAGT